MADEPKAVDEVKKSRKAMIGALVAVVLVAGGTGLMYVAGFGPFAPDEPEVVAPKPTETAEAEEADESDEAATPVANPATVPLPPDAAQEAMYWEQVSSAEKIGELVDNQFAAFEFTEVTKSTDTANIRIKATYRDGGVLNGWIVLKNYEGAWYFQSIAADGSSSAAAPDLGTPDADVLKAIVDQQAANQDVYTAILNGTYNKFTIDKIVVGSGAKTLEITLSGPAKTGDAGKVTCISKDAGTGMQWFITAFSQ